MIKDVNQYDFDQKKGRIYYILFYLFMIGCVFVIVGCANHEQLVERPIERGSVLECRDGHLYSIISQTRYELIEQDGCSKGKIELK